MSLRLMASGCLAALLAVSQAATAQSPTLRGPWLGAGIGTASASVNCELCVDDRNGGFSGYVTGGITLSPSVRAGAELMGWFDNTNEISQRLLLYGASLYWSPVATSRWYLKGGLGLLNYHADDTADPDDDPLNAGTAALQLGSGYEFRAGPRLGVAPYLNLVVTTSGNLTSGNTIVTDASFSLLQLGVGVTWR
jgi:opacity protein-like surface antigen